MAEEVNAVRDVLTGVVDNLTDCIDEVIGLLNHPATVSFIETSEELNNNDLGIFCDFTKSDNCLPISSVTQIPDIYYTEITENTDCLYFPKLYCQKKNSLNNIQQFNLDQWKVITFQIWIALHKNVCVNTISLPAQYTALDTDEVFPSQLNSLVNDQNCKTIYVFPVRLSNTLNFTIPDVQISYAYRFIAGKGNTPILSTQ